MAERKTKPASGARSTRKAPTKAAAAKPVRKAAPARTKTAATAKPAKAKPAAKAKTPAKAKPAVKAKPARRKAPAASAQVAPRARTKAVRRSKRTAVARSKAEAQRDVALIDSLGTLRDLLAEHVVLTVERLQDALDDAVRNGRIMPGDAQDLGQRIAHAGRRQLDELLAEVDKLRSRR